MDGKTFTISFQPTTIRFANIYEPAMGSPQRDRFHFVLWADPPHYLACSHGIAELSPSMRNGKAGAQLTLFSWRRPPVYTPDHPAELMVKALAILDAQNRTRDHVFNFCHTIEAVVKEWVTEGKWGPMQGQTIRGLSIEYINAYLNSELLK